MLRLFSHPIYSHLYTSKLISLRALHLYQLFSTPHLNLLEINRLVENLDRNTYLCKFCVSNQHTLAYFVEEDSSLPDLDGFSVFLNSLETNNNNQNASDAMVEPRLLQEVKATLSSIPLTADSEQIDQTLQRFFSKYYFFWQIINDNGLCY